MLTPAPAQPVPTADSAATANIPPVVHAPKMARDCAVDVVFYMWFSYLLVLLNDTGQRNDIRMMKKKRKEIHDEWHGRAWSWA